MLEAEIRFAREGREGVVAVGTYLIDAAKRFGIHFEEVCFPDASTHHCSVVVASGSDLLSNLTKAETDYFAANGRKTNERLACQVKIDKAGKYSLSLKPETIRAEKKFGLTLVSVKLVPVQK